MQRRPAIVLFLSLFAAQASVLVLAPILPAVARDFGISTATGGQLRAVSAMAGGLTALGLGRLARRLGVRDLLVAGLALDALGLLASAAAPTFAVLAAAQVAIGAGVAIVLTAGVAAAADWSPAGRRSRVLAWTLLGQPAAWVAGMPIVGAVEAVDWRLCWVVVPLASAVVAVLAVRARRPDPPATAAVAWRSLLRRGPVAGWAVGELLAFAGWGGTLVYAGALFVESHGLSPRDTGVLLGIAALAYFPGTLLARRHVETSPRALLIGLGVAAAVTVAVFGLVRPAAWFSWLVFAASVGLAGGRAIAGSAFGLDSAPDERVAVMAVRAAATQFGYLLGAGLGGLALAVGGYGVLGAVLGALFLGAVLPHVAAIWTSGGSRGAASPTTAAAPFGGRAQVALAGASTPRCP